MDRRVHGRGHRARVRRAGLGVVAGMTVAELIEELQKFPGHHRAFVEFPDFAEPKIYGYAATIASIAKLRADGDCCVVIDATGGVQ